MPNVLGHQSAMEQHVDAGQSGGQREHGERRAVAGELDGEARCRRSDERGDRAAEREGGKVFRALRFRAQGADQIVDRDVEVDVPEAEKRRAQEERRQAAADER